MAKNINYAWGISDQTTIKAFIQFSVSDRTLKFLVWLHQLSNTVEFFQRSNNRKCEFMELLITLQIVTANKYLTKTKQDQ